MMRGKSIAGVPAVLLVLLLLVPTLQAAVAKPKPKPKPKATPKKTPKKLTWKPLSRNVQWQWQLDDNGLISKVKGVTMYDIDFDSAADQIKGLRKAIKGVQIICYISVGTWESQRQELDRTRRQIPVAVWKGITGKSYSPPFQDEKWLDIRHPRVKTIMLRRFEYAKRIGCDWTLLRPHDRMQAGVDNHIHCVLCCRLKNTVGLLPQLYKSYDWFLNEQCSEDNSCGAYSVVGKVKPVLIVEYCDATEQDNGTTQDPGCFCPALIKAGFNPLLKTTDVNGMRTSCREYCSRYKCPGRGRRPNCNAAKPNVCATVFRVPPVKKAAG